MKYEKIILAAALLLCTFTAVAQSTTNETHRNYYVAKAGTLITQLTEEEANEITHLTLTGKINAVDFRHLRDEFKRLEVLDISNASISMYAGKAGTYPNSFRVYPPNCIPPYAFCRAETDGTFTGKASLREVVLSEKTQRIEDAAFRECGNLEVCRIQKKTTPFLQPEALDASLTAVFVPAGSGDEYRVAKHWSSLTVIEGEPTRANLQVGKLETLAEALQKERLQPKEVNFLTVEGKLDEADFKLIRDYMPNLIAVDISRCNATAIPEYTFTQKKYLMRIQLPQELRRIGERAFSGCGRLSGTLFLPAGVTAIEYGAFLGCGRLKRVVASGNSITTLGENLFGEEANKLEYIR